MTWETDSLRTGWHGLEYHSPRCGAVRTKGDSGNANYPRHDVGLVSDCVDMVKMTWERLNVDYLELKRRVIGKIGKPSIIAQ